MRSGQTEPPRQAESGLIKRVVSGDKEALGEAFRRHAARVHRIAYGVSGSQREAEDIVQEVFAALPERLGTFEGRSSLATWLHRVTVRETLQRIRKVRRGDRLNMRVVPRELSTEGVSTVDRIALQQAFSTLPEEDRTVLWLKVVEGWTHGEIAAALDITENASYQRLYRARRRLRDAWDRGE